MRCIIWVVFSVLLVGLSIPAQAHLNDEFVVLFPGWTAFPQAAPTTSKTNDANECRTPSGVLLYTYRTASHLRRSSPQVFQKTVDEVSRFLSTKNVLVRGIIQVAPSEYQNAEARGRYENLSVGHDVPAVQPSTFARGRASGARYVLVLVVDRPIMSWIRLSVQCFDLSGSLLWEAQGGESALTSKGGLQQALRSLEGQLAARTDELSRALEETSTPTPVVVGEESAPGQSENPLSRPVLPGAEKQFPDASSRELLIEKGEPVSLLLLDTVSSKNCKLGDRIRFRIIDPVVIEDLVVVPGRAEAWGTVTAIKPPRRRLRSAEVTIKLEEVVLLNGNTAPLNAEWRIRGNVSPERSSDITEGVARTYLLALPFVPLMHGDQLNIPKGSEFSATFAERIVLDRAEIKRLQPPTSANANGPATVTFYNTDENSASPAIWCGKVKLGKLSARTHYTITLSPDTYWIRSESKKSAFPLTAEQGGEYFIRVSSIMTWGNSSNPGYTQHITLVKHDVGELQASNTEFLDSRHHTDFSKADPALLRAKPSE